MRILRVAQKIYPDAKGGGPYHVHAMSRDQAAMGHDVTVVTVRMDPDLPHIEERDGYTVVRYDPTVNLLGNDISHGIAQYLSQAEAFDVMHAHSHLYFSTNLAAMKRFLGDIPLAITNHGLYSQNAPEWAFDLYLRTLGRWTFNQADVVFCYTETDKERVREFGVSSRIDVVSNGIDTERFTPDGPESELIDAEGPVVLFVGRLVEGKRPERVLDAVNRLSDDYDINLYFCGDGPLRSKLEANGGSEAEFLGSVPYDEMPEIYRAADLLTLTSRAEGVPRTIMEALAAEVPVVSSDLPQVRAAFGDDVAYAPQEDANAFSEQVRAILESKTNPQLHEQFSWERTVTETTAALNQLVEETD
ncbi:putative glycosyltransferase, type 1 [Natrialba magadii ATCC 43099]|uniref:Glycosyltransferase, type 1 n=1 Tax=Natrialba magadii (strain ATCC 43099 / DSM 3394 / CCM 3739 / CIP 104546 / IAM 13178 / JCM 8861 / NBRC 102185 / NCIMB 2190 / MS3) TaxID=547559 RepID=D3SWD7_NATMM|nr:glycosyltransferase family 4 protein [Natrialba magadii]ADD03729.1 putative glycosyltransferase, type 1 [Natrialba magadii ATCC 43099]ELY33784.1 group 1 glycosyl transferase [Natrialba magadii ATCC 43099]